MTNNRAKDTVTSIPNFSNEAKKVLLKLKDRNDKISEESIIAQALMANYIRGLRAGSWETGGAQYVGIQGKRLDSIAASVFEKFRKDVPQ